MGVYTLLVVGATTALTGAADACRSWPACGGRWYALDSTSLAIVWGHRTAAVVTGLLVVAATVMAWRRGESTRVRGAVSAAFLLYPVQVGVGALTATTGSSAALAGAHLALGVAIFASLVLALAWTLETQTGDLPSKEWEGAARGDDEPATQPGTGPLATAYAYFRLMKPRLMWLLCLVASAGMALAAGSDLQTGTVLATLGGGVLAIGASGTFNHVLEREKDKKMQRTNDRPVVTDRIPIRNAVAFGVALAVASLAAFYAVNALTAFLGLTAIVFYSVIYTLVLKPNTRQSTVIGGAAGALPALIGWAAVTGNVGVAGIALATVIFLWTPAHFYNLALAYKDDYERGGFPLMPVVKGEATTRKHILYYLGATLVSAVALAALTGLGALFAGTTVALGAVFLYFAVRLHRERDRAAAMRSFHASNAYLGCLLVAVVLDAMVV
ncbi:heme o synthase [Halobacterium litoreum]|uniref:Protoheme IX farnesyltransferase n=1 Tax=Halobacterium litoreum TaxID=2039234 RepID=A0ABD5NHU4_9EURY|nr:heme o synthase [Halobacterium litoreum]UHH14864.1 heme o synthase [Halobacterium litoreum]